MTARKDGHYGRLTQWLECDSYKVVAVGSIPTPPTLKRGAYIVGSDPTRVIINSITLRMNKCYG